jgi:hypothetical protein
MDLTVDKTAFNADPFIGCPFDSSDIELVQDGRGLSVGQQVEFQTPSGWKLGTVAFIGANAKYCDGTSFTAFVVRRRGVNHLRIQDEVRPQKSAV